MNSAEYNQCIRQHSDSIYRYLLKNTRNQADAKDLVQTTFIKLWEKRDGIDGQKVKSWLFSTAHNAMIDQFRRKKPDTPVMPIHLGSRSDEQQLELRDLINQALDHLPVHFRQVILLRDYEGYTYQDIADITGMSLDQVKVYIFRGRKKLQHILRRIDFDTQEERKLS